MKTLDCHTRRSALHITLALIIGTLAIAGIAEEIKKRKAVDSYLRFLDSRIERVDISSPGRTEEWMRLGQAHSERRDRV
jgi:hypothetical protein